MSEIVSKAVSSLKRNYKMLLLSGIFYIGGIVIGVIYYFSKNLDATFLRHVFKFYNNIVDCSVSPLSTFFIRLAIDVGYVAIVFALSFTVFTYPITLLFIAYRGAIIGCIAGLFIHSFGFNGVAVYFTVILPQNLIVTAGLTAIFVLNFDYVVNKPSKCKLKIELMLKNCLLGFIICSVGAIYELFITVIVIRPMNFYF